MSVTDRVWGALTSIIKLEDKVNRQADAMKAQQQRIDAGLVLEQRNHFGRATLVEQPVAIGAE